MPESGEQGSPIPDPNEFDGEESEVNTRTEFRSTFAETLAQHGFSDTLVLARERAEDVFHGRRLEILDHLKMENPASVRSLADELGYDKGVVSRDLKRLAAIDVIKYENVGRAKAPRLKHDHVVIEPVV